MISESWSPIDSDIVPLRNQKITTVMLVSRGDCTIAVNLTAFDFGSVREIQYPAWAGTFDLDGKECSDIEWTGVRREMHAPQSG
jgi:hypothetical protein